jgi:HPt (histidine-containing phosphotransfer) domain-containing protein
MATPSNSAEIDPAALARLRRLGGDKLLRDMIDLFLQHAPQRVEQALAAGAAGNLPDIGRAVHSLKSSAANVGATALHQLSAQIEAVATGETPGDAIALLADLQATFDRARVSLEQQRKELAP